MICATIEDRGVALNAPERTGHRRRAATWPYGRMAAILLAALWTARPAGAQTFFARAIESSLDGLDGVDVMAVQAGERQTSARDAGQGAATEPLTVLRSRTAAGELVVVRTMAGEEIVGTIDMVTETEVALQVDGRVRRVAAGDVRQVVSARRTSLWRRGLLIGAGAGALGAVMRCIDPMDTAGNTDSCATDAVAILAVSPGIGMLVGSLIHRDRLLYSTAPVEEPEDEDLPRTVMAPEDIGSVVKALHTLYVRTTDGERLEGGFVRASAASLTLEDRGQTFDVPTDRIREVRMRGGRRWRRGMVIGTLAGAAVGTGAVLLTADSDEERSWAIVATVAGSVYGLGIGALLGTFSYHRPIIYQTAPARVTVAPVVTPRFIGVRASIAF